MAIQNSRSKAQSRKAKKMEMQEAVHTNGNHVAENSPTPHPEGSPPAPAAPRTSVELTTMMQRREKMITALNEMKAQMMSLREQAQQMEDQAKLIEGNVKTNEGALIMLNTLISEIDPAALQQPRMGG
jgi:hypothetical protein